jgi:type IV pilus assembly protein PilV
MRTNKQQAGVMLIEALIGILIFSIGILALLGMQGTAVKNTTDAKYRSEAAFLATQIAGQMWVDDKDKLARYNTADPTPYAPRDSWVNNVSALLPGVATGDAPAPKIQVGSDAATAPSTAIRSGAVEAAWRERAAPSDHPQPHPRRRRRRTRFLPWRKAGMSLVELWLMLINIGILIITHIYVTNDKYAFDPAARRRSTARSRSTPPSAKSAWADTASTIRWRSAHLRRVNCSPVQYYYNGTSSFPPAGGRRRVLPPRLHRC